MTRSAHIKTLVKLIQDNGYRHHIHDVFRDFMELAACSVSNTIDPLNAAVREERYMQVIGKYDAAEQQRFPKMFATLVDALEDGPDDVLGAVFGELEQGNARTGQFFTPYSLCRLMAEMTVGDGDEIRAEIDRKGFITASEPAVGAGAQIIALAEAMQKAGLNYQEHLHVTAVDVDARAVHMAYLQLSLLSIPAIVVLGNTLTLEEREHWRTPAHFLGLWDNKLRRGYALGSAMDGADKEEPAVLSAMPLPADIQLDLFGIKEAA